MSALARGYIKYSTYSDLYGARYCVVLAVNRNRDIN